MPFSPSRSADAKNAKKIEKPAPADSVAADTSIAASSAGAPAVVTPPTGTKVPEAKPIMAQTQPAGTPVGLGLGLRIAEPGADTSRGITVPEASKVAAKNIREHLRKKSVPLGAPSKEEPAAEPAPTSVRVDATASSNAETIMADSVPPPPKDPKSEVRKSHITPEEQKAALAAGGPVADTPKAPARFDRDPPEVVPSRAEVEAAKKAKKGSDVINGPAITVRDVTPDTRQPSTKNTAETPKPAKVEETPKKIAGWKGYLFLACGGVLGLLFAALVIKFAVNGDATAASVGDPAITAEPKASQQLPTVPTDPKPVPSTSEIVFPTEGLSMTPDTLQKLFGQTDAKNFRYFQNEWDAHRVYPCYCAATQDAKRGTWDADKKQHFYPLFNDADRTSDMTGCRICKHQ